MKIRSILLLILAETSAMSLWFVTASVLEAMNSEASIGTTREALLSSVVQIGFVIGAVLSAIFALSDRFDPRKLFALSAIVAASANASLAWLPIGGNTAITMRFLTGALLAGVYPVGMKLAVGWGTKDRGFLVGLLVGALTLGSAAPYFLSFLGGSDWRSTVLVSSSLAAAGGLLVLPTALGPHHQSQSGFSFKHLSVAFSSHPIRLAFLGYLGHMWELYAMWSWIAAAVLFSFSQSMPESDALSLAKICTFVAIALGGVACIAGGLLADRIGKARFSIIALSISAAAALATALSIGGSPLVTFALVVIWGIAIIPDSAQFSALVADYSPPESAGSIITLQTAFGFLLTFFPVQAVPSLVQVLGWQWLIGLLAFGPLMGVWAMSTLLHYQQATENKGTH